MKPEHLKLLRDRFWRLNNLYFITDKNGKKVRFRMTQEQIDYFQGMHTRNIILKARQLGFTTLVCIVQLDAALFESAKCALIAHTLNDAKRLFREKIKFAYDCLPDEIKKANPASNDAAGELVFSKGGSLYVSTSFRGGTLRYLHVSEFGKICAKFPHKAREIVTGAFEAVATDCFVTIESTAEGRAGYFFDYSQSAEKQQLAGVPLGKLDWKFFFFSWWRNPFYWLDPNDVVIPDRLTSYFDELHAKHGIVTNPGQRAWYAAKEKTLGDDMKREYASSHEAQVAGVLSEGATFISGFGLDPIESAISNAASSASGADGMTVLILQDHLKKLCKLQRDNFSSSPTTRVEVHVSDAFSLTGDPATATNLKTTGCEIKPGR